MLSWIPFVKKFAKEHNIPYLQTLWEIKDSYVKGRLLTLKIFEIYIDWHLW